MEVAPAASLRGALRVPGDKSISHRALLVGAVCDGATLVRGFGRSLDTESTMAGSPDCASRTSRSTAETQER